MADESNPTFPQEQDQAAIAAQQARQKQLLDAYNAILNQGAPVNPYKSGGGYMGAADYQKYLESQNAYQTQLTNAGAAAGVLSADEARRQAAANSGMAQGLSLYNDPNMMALLDKRIDLSKGYSGEELGAKRAEAIGQIQGQRSNYLNQLASKTARSGVGGARAAAMQGAADVGFAGQRAGAETKMLQDSAEMERKGTSDLQDYLMKQKYGIQASSAKAQEIASSDYAASQQRASSGGSSGPCCFIFLEARYGNGVMDSVVRKFRDENMTSRNRRGYYKLSEVLVPLMRQHKLVKLAVQTFMTTPLVAYGKAYYGGNKLGFIFAPIKNFWMRTFDLLGQDHKFIRENGEVI